jgi:hypothetical protein
LLWDACAIWQRTPRGWCEKLVDVAEGSGYYLLACNLSCCIQ